MKPAERSARLFRRVVGARGMPHDDAVSLVWRIHAKVGGLFRHLHPQLQSIYTHRSMLTGMVRATEFGVQYEIAPLLCRLRGGEFAKPKYKKMQADQVQFLKDLFDLNLTLQGVR